MLVFPILRTSRLILRQLEIDDLASLVKYANNPKIAKYILNIPYPYGEPNAVFRFSYVVQGWKLRSRFVFAIVDKGSNEVVGEISLHLVSGTSKAEIGYWIGEPFWGKGMITEAIEIVVRFGFDKLNLTEIFGTCSMENTASIIVLQKNGFKSLPTTGRVLYLSISNKTPS